MKIARYYSADGSTIVTQVKWASFDVKILRGDGSVKFEQRDVTAPAAWSQNAVNILVDKYFRRAGVPSETVAYRKLGEDGYLPIWLYRSQPTPDATFGGETSAVQVFHRLAGCWTYWAWYEGLLGNEEDALALYDELFLMLARQVAAPNSPQWFNTGLYWAYGVAGPAARGHWATPPDAGSGSQPTQAYEVTSIYERPQPSACFIQTVEDSLVDEGGMMDLWTREARLFKYGSGSGSNLSAIRAKDEKLSGGGTSSGLMSFLPVGDRSAGSIKSGGTTRRAALMRVLNLDHPEILDFVGWKAHEEAKAAMIAVGSRVLHERLTEVRDRVSMGEDQAHPLSASGAARVAGVPEALIDRAREGMVPDVIVASSFEGEAIETVSGQNANNSVRVTDEFLRRVDANEDWQLTARTTGEIVRQLPARELWDAVVRAAWASGDPGVQFHDTTNAWHTCAADGEINASNPCSEYVFLDDTACNLASLRLTAFLKEDGSLDLAAYRHATWLWTLVLEVSVYMASYPSRRIAERSHLYHTLGLGYADLGGLLMRLALPYDSGEGRALAGALTSLMTGVAYECSAAMASELGPFPRWEANAADMRRVLYQHREHLALQASQEGLAGPVFQEAHAAWAKVATAEAFRNAQVTVIAPTGTISLVMDCDTGGAEPDFSLVKRKQLSGGGAMEIVNQAVPTALKKLGLSAVEIERCLKQIEATGSLEGANVSGLDDYLSIFDCANPAREGGRCLSVMAHVLMVAAIQPHVSGGISKTINLPRTATIADVDQVYREAHRLGVKSVALYRDGSKLTQPLSGGTLTVPPDSELTGQSKNVQRQTYGRPGDGAGRLDTLARGAREYPPWRRERVYLQKVKISDQSVFLTVSEYPDGRPCEVFLELAHEGSTLRAMANGWAMMISLALQHGTPLEVVVDRLLHTQFEPRGIVEGHNQIALVTSILDFVGRELALRYLARGELAQKSAVSEVKPGVATIEKREIVATTLTGEVCGECGNATMRRRGTCLTCDTCGANTGCG